MIRLVPILVAALCATMAIGANAEKPADTTIEGRYVEVRSCDVYTAACYANSETSLEGKEAILTWDITQGAWEGVDLTGLKVMAVVRTKSTLTKSPEKAKQPKTILVVDEKATGTQKEALMQFAKSMAGSLAKDIVKVEDSAITVDVQGCAKGTCAAVTAGDLVEIKARCLHNGDKTCGNDEPYYPPLTKLDSAMAHFTELDSFQGEGLGVKWSDTGRRSAYVGTFSR